jgi:hypothetical protein
MGAVKGVRREFAIMRESSEKVEEQRENRSRGVSEKRPGLREERLRSAT